MAKTKSTTKRAGIIESAVNAVEELGEAATSFKDSWSHVEKAGTKAKPATRAAKRAGKATVKAAKRMLPGKKKRGKK
ncbi:MAG: hypothetical protein V4474_00730 [Patescibacteria group bacterium]